MKILFISHEATRTGAPYVLLHLCKWMKENTNIKIDVLLLADGPLISEFRKFSNRIFIKESTQPSYLNRAIRKVSHSLYNQYSDNKQIRKLSTIKYSVIYANSIASLNFALKLKKDLRAPLILHLHELSLNIELYHKHLAGTQKEVNHFICASKSVRENVVQNFGVPEEKTSIIYEFVDFKSLKYKIDVNRKLSTKHEAFTICASGTLYWRKNPDTFIQVAMLVRKKLPKISFKFIWVGADDNRNLKVYLEDIKKTKSDSFIEIKKKTDNPFVYFNSADLFLMTSKEDPFPLVCIEAGYLGKPIICFENAGGIPEMLEVGGGKIVPYLDNEAMANEIINYYKDRESLKADGAFIKHKVLEYDVENQAPKVLAIIEKVKHE